MYRVLVFPSCNEPGLEVCNALVKSNKIEVYAGSSVETRFDASSMLFRHHIRCPSLYEKGFADEFRKIVERERIDVVFPTVDALVAEFARWDIPNTKFITPNPATAELLLSKAKTYATLAETVPVPTVYDRQTAELPAFAKPDVGSGSKDAMVVRNRQELDLALSRDLLITELLPGPEYTVDCVNDLEGNVLHCCVRLRGVVGRGIALGTEAVASAEIEAYIQAIARRIKIEGPWFAQFKTSRNGQPKLMEVNSRVAGSMTLTRLSGVNIPLISVFLFTGHRIEIPKPLANALINRCLNAVGNQTDFRWVVWDFDDTIIRKDGKPDPDILACLYDCHNRGVRQLLLTKNPDVRQIMLEQHIPDFFVGIRYAEDKASELENLMREHQIKPSECVMINDSFSETLALQRRFPDVRLVHPDAVGVLGREKLA